MVKTMYITMRVPVRVQSNLVSSSAFVYLSLAGDDAKTTRGAIKALRARMNEHIRSLKKFYREEKHRRRG